MPLTPAAPAPQQPATERGRRSRAAIIDAAATMMYDRGVASTSLDDVLSAAGCGKSQMYYYFDDKSDLRRAVIDRQLEIVLSHQTAIAGVHSWAGLRRWADQIVENHSVHGGPFACPLGAMAAELKNDPAYVPSLDAAFRRWEEPLAEGLEKMRQRGQLSRSVDPQRMAELVIATLQGGMLLARIHADVTLLADTVETALLSIRRRATPAQRLRQR